MEPADKTQKQEAFEFVFARMKIPRPNQV